MNWTPRLNYGEPYGGCMMAMGKDRTLYYVMDCMKLQRKGGWLAWRVLPDGRSKDIGRRYWWRWLAIRACERVEAKR